MKIGIDARFYGPIGKGLGRYTQKLIENLEKIDTENQYFIFLRKENITEYKPKNKNFRKVLADYKWYTWQEQILFPRLINKHGLDLVHFPHFNVPLFYFRKFIVTIHDLILIHFPTVKSSTLHPLIYWFKFAAYKAVIKSAIYRSSRIIAVSNFTKNDILDNYPKIPQEKVRVTYEACEEYALVSPNKDRQILGKYAIIRPYILYVGNAYPHKNLERLILAFQTLHEQHKDLKLVLVGNIDYFYKRIMHFVRDKNVDDVIFLGYVPDYELDTIYQNAEAFVWPSLYEGFGLPPLEAMAKGVPVISSDHDCMKEIIQESACYFDGKDAGDMAQNISNVLEKKEVRENLIKKGFIQIGKYSWKRMAKETLEIYNNCS
jgi:glycosyltransferase involved in cell wall biosynthesis